MPEPHRIVFTTTASTVFDVPNTGQSREEATEQACAEAYVSLCHQCAREVDLGDFEPYEEEDPDGDTGTRAIVEEFRPAEVEPGLSIHGIITRATRTATTSIKNDNGDSVYSRGNVVEAIRLLVAAIRELDRVSDGE